MAAREKALAADQNPKIAAPKMDAGEVPAPEAPIADAAVEVPVQAIKRTNNPKADVAEITIRS